MKEVYVSWSPRLFFDVEAEIRYAIPDPDPHTWHWATETLCFQHSEELLGRKELIRRYDATHERTWAEMKAANAPGFD